jgi:hypothetical protein
MTFINSNNNSNNIMNLKWTEDLAYNSKWAPASIKSTQVPILPARAVIIVSLHIRRSLRPPHRPLRPRLPLLLHQVGSFLYNLDGIDRDACNQSRLFSFRISPPSIIEKQCQIFLCKNVQNTWLAEVLLKSPEIRHVNRY